MLSGSGAVRFEDGTPPTLAVALDGAAWVLRAGADSVRLGPGDVAVVSGGSP